MNLIDGTFALIFRPNRRFGTIIPHVTVREVHRDELVITDHPVETGAAISDHAFKRPSEVEMTCGWSDSGMMMSGYVRQVYQEILKLQTDRQPFSVSTGKRNYKNMLVASLAVQTDDKTENALVVTARFREIIITSTQTTSAPKTEQASPEKTGETSDKGPQQAKPEADGGWALGEPNAQGAH